MKNRSIRRLTHLQSTAATCRVLNLVKIAQLFGHEDEYRARPLFRNRFLNQAIILKHRLRGTEIDLFDSHRTVATKIILPIDRGDLNAGGQYVFIGQRNQTAALAQFLGESAADNLLDQRTLNVLDGLPSFDPFLLREQLRRKGLTPAQCYFTISPADTRRMMGYVQTELGGLSGLLSGDKERFQHSAASLAAKLMSNESTEDMAPLRLSMRMSKDEFAEGLFAWKGLLYYKWVLHEMEAQLPEVARELQTIQPFDSSPSEGKAQLNRSRRRLLTAVNQARLAAVKIIRIYDYAFAGLSTHSQPLLFRDFLVRAPDLFMELGECLGVLSHIISFWRFRFKSDIPPSISFAELSDIMLDFESGLGQPHSPSDVAQAIPRAKSDLAGLDFSHNPI